MRERILYQPSVFRMRSFQVLLLLVATLSGCASLEKSALVRVAHQLVRQSDATERSEFAPPFHYLRVVVDGNAIFLASDTSDIDSISQPSTWYSAGKEVLRFQDGRLVAAVGLKTEWRGVSIPHFPRWSELAMTKAPLKWMRVRDVMPGYRYGIKDSLVLAPIAVPSDSRLKDIPPGSLTWFEERFEPSLKQQNALPPARYAVEIRDATEVVVYGEQCISDELCLSWQRWPVRAERLK